MKFARFPVTGLIEGCSYIFRVRAVNKTGIGLPSRVSEPVAALDPAEKARLKSKRFSIFKIFLNLFLNRFIITVELIVRSFLSLPLEGEENRKSFISQKILGETKKTPICFLDSSIH